MHSIIQKSWNQKEPLNSMQLQGCRRGNQDNTAPEVQGLISTASISTEKFSLLINHFVNTSKNTSKYGKPDNNQALWLQ